MTSIAPSKRPIHRIVWLAIVCLWLLVALLLTLHALSLKSLMVDEAEHLHAAWNISRGELPYRDFFEHHPPLFWYLTAPLTAGRSSATTGFVLTCRAISAGVTVLLTLVFFLWFGRLFGSLLAHIASLAMLGIYLYRGGFLEMRPDFLALLFVLLAMLQLGQRLSAPNIRADGHIFISGICLGISSCLTQKAFITSVAIISWWIGTILLAPSALRRSRFIQLMAFVVGLAVPLIGLAGFFASHGALRPLFHCVIAVNSRWAREEFWTTTWRTDGNFGFGIYALAFVEVLSVVRHLPAELRLATPRSLVALLLIAGTAAFVTTPVPYGQSFLFFIVPWVAWLSFSFLSRYVHDIRPAPRHVILLVVMFIVLGLTLDPRVAVKTAAIWAAVMVCGWFVSRRLQIPAPFLLSLLAIPMGAAVRAIAADWRSHPPTAVNPIEAAIDRYAPPPQPILSMWHVPRPFQQIPVYHWFAHPGVIETIGGDVIADEYLSALRSGKVRVAVVSEQDLRQRMPGVLAFLEKHAILVARTGGRYANNVYVVPDRGVHAGNSWKSGT